MAVGKAQDKYHDALAELLESLQVTRLVYGNNDPRVAATLHKIGEVKKVQGKNDDALAEFQESLRIRRLVYGNHHSEVGMSLFFIGIVYQEQGHCSAALQKFSQVLRIVQSHFPEDDPARCAIVETIRVTKALAIPKRTMRIIAAIVIVTVHGYGFSGFALYALFQVYWCKVEIGPLGDDISETIVILLPELILLLISLAIMAGAASTFPGFTSYVLFEAILFGVLGTNEFRPLCIKISETFQTASHSIKMNVGKRFSQLTLKNLSPFVVAGVFGNYSVILAVLLYKSRNVPEAIECGFRSQYACSFYRNLKGNSDQVISSLRDCLLSIKVRLEYGIPTWTMVIFFTLTTAFLLSSYNIAQSSDAENNGAQSGPRMTEEEQFSTGGNQEHPVLQEPSPPRHSGRIRPLFSSFQDWLSSFPEGQKTDLRDQVAFAIQIYNYDLSSASTANTTGVGQLNNADNVILNLKNTPLPEPADDNLSPLVSYKGISVDWFLDVFCEIAFVKRLLEMDCQLWFVRKVCVIELLRRKGVSNGPLIDHVHHFCKDISSVVRKVPTKFVSYTGRYSFSGCVELLQDMRGEYIWMDLWCVDQFAWTGHAKSKQVANLRKELIGGLKRQISAIGSVVLFLEQWDTVVETLRQIWVLWEIFNAVDVGVKLNVMVSQAEIDKYIQLFYQEYGVDRIQAALTDINVERCVSEDEVARQAILMQMKSKKRGLYNVSKIVTTKLRQWYCQVGVKHAPSLESRKESDLVYLAKIGLLLRLQGNLTEATSFCERAMLGFSEIFEDDNPQSILSINNMALLLRDQGKLEDAKPLLQRALVGCRQVLGDEHLTTHLLINNLALLLQDQGKFDEAEPLFFEALKTSRRILGDEHNSTLLLMGNIALLLQKRGKMAEAQLFCKKALDGMRRLTGGEHPDTLLLMHNMACILYARSNLKDAEPLYQESLSSSRRLLGDEHPTTLLIMSNLALVLKDQGKLDNAKQLFREALGTSRRVLGGEHTTTLLSANNIALLVQEQGRFDDAKVRLSWHIVGCLGINILIPSPQSTMWLVYCILKEN